jgi:hypothetical protein
VKQLDSSPRKFPDTDWRRLGEHKVRAGSDALGSITAWLTQTLRPLNLPTDLTGKILRSAHEAAARALHLNESSAGYGHIHLVALAPSHHTDKGQTWGFFRMEKLEASPAGESPPGHSIELYLYIDG